MGIGIMAFWILCGVFSAIIATGKNRNSAGWFFVGLFFGPFGLLVACLPPISSDIQNRSDTNLTAQSLISEFEERWQTLVKYDDEAKQSLDRVGKFGLKAINELKKAYNVIGDPSKLSGIADKVCQEMEIAQKAAEVQKVEELKVIQALMEEYGITIDGDQYVYKTHRYDKLEYAIDYAKKQVKASEGWAWRALKL